MIILKLAYRNLWRNKRRTQLTMGAMIFACSLLVFSLGYYDGILWNLINNATEKENGHITIAAKSYIENPTLNLTIPQNTSLPPIIEKDLKGICPRINVFGLLSKNSEGKSRTQPTQILGVDPEKEKKCSRLSKSIIQGSFLGVASNSVILGKGLAQKLEAKIGDEIILMSSAADGSMVSELLTLKGIFDTEDPLRDSSLAIINIKSAQTLFALETKIHSLRLFVKNPLQSKIIAKKIANLSPKLEATPWNTMFPQISNGLEIWFSMQVFTTIIYYSAVLLITFNTMYMAFLERLREFAIIGAIGLTKVRLAGLIVSESCMIATTSAFIGSLIGLVLNFTLHSYPIPMDRWMSSISWGGSNLAPEIFCVPSIMNTLLPFLSMIALGFIVAALPAWKLFRLKPVEALREV